MRADRFSFAALGVLAAALLAAPLAAHVDDTDAQLYRVLAANMERARDWLEPGLPPGDPQPFREHLPFGLWPYVAALRAGAPPEVAALALSLATVALCAWLGARLGGAAAGLASGLLLALTETFFLYGGRARLEPPLLLLATSAAAPLLLARGAPRWRDWLVGATFASLAALVKGPFGLVPFAGAAGAQVLLQRSPRVLGAAAAAGVAALAPLAIFLTAERGAGWDRYVVHQLLASATGARTDGVLAWWYPLRTLAGRFWPGLPFAVWGAAAALRETGRQRRALALASALAVGVLMLPARKLWNHALVVYPLLAVLAGVTAAPLLARVVPRVRAAALATCALVAVALSASGIGAELLRPPCVLAHDFAPQLVRFPPGTPVLVASREPDYHLIVALTEERGLAPWYVRALPPGQALDAHGPGEETQRARLAIADLSGGPPPPPWRELTRAQGLALLERP